MSMMLLEVCALTAILLAGQTWGVAVNRNCNEDYQKALRETLALKKECGNAAFDDCCQAKMLYPMAQSWQATEISDVCDGPWTISNKVWAWCDMVSDGGGWLVIQHWWLDGTVDFDLDWWDYENGFGELETEFWWGLRNIHCLTTREDMELMIELRDWDGNNMTWTYERFTVDGPRDDYRLHIGPGEGPPGWHDTMAWHDNWWFSTKDRDNDGWRDGSCAQAYKGGWWYNSCWDDGPFNANIPAPPNSDQTAWWWWWWNGDSWVEMQWVEMKVRPKTCWVADKC